MTSSMSIPRTSDTLPLVTIYLLVLTVISVFTVVMSIIIVYFHHREEKETKRVKATSNFKGIFNKIRLMNRTATNFTKVKPDNPPSLDQVTVTPNDSEQHQEKKTSDQTESVLNVMNKLKMKAFNGGSKISPTSPSAITDDSGTNAWGKNTQGDGSRSRNESAVYVNRWRQIGKHLDFVSFVVFTVIWVSVTLGFLIAIAA